MDLTNVLNRIKISGLGFLGVFIVGTIGFGILSDGQWFNAFYMTAITISTIGFAEVIDLSDSQTGRIFTVLIAFSGIGVMTYLFSNLAALFIEGDIKKTFTINKMIKKINKLKDHYIICGSGRIGRNIAEELHLSNLPFVIADINEDMFENLDIEDALYLLGDCTENEFLKTLGIERAKGIFATTGDDNTNLVITISAKQIKSNIKIVARTKAIKHNPKMLIAGANNVVSPNYIGGLRMTSEMIRPTVTTFLDQMMRNSHSPLHLEEMIIPEKINDKPTSEFPLEGCKQTLILAIKDDDKWIYNPYPDYIMKTGNHIVLMTTPTDSKLIQTRL